MEKLPWANTVEMTRGVEDVIRTLEPGLPGVHFDTTIFQQANFIELAIDNLTQALVLGFLLVVVILGLFLFEWRVALISLLTIPLSLDGDAAGAALARADGQHHDPGRVWSSRSARSSTTRSSTWRTSCAGCASTDGPAGAGHPRAR